MSTVMASCIFELQKSKLELNSGSPMDNLNDPLGKFNDPMEDHKLSVLAPHQALGFFFWGGSTRLCSDLKASKGIRNQVHRLIEELLGQRQSCGPECLPGLS